jgi:hypothetical protein
LWTSSGLPAAAATLPEFGIDPSALAATMVTEENLPMVRNNCRPPADDDVRHLAARTVAVWSALRP